MLTFLLSFFPTVIDHSKPNTEYVTYNIACSNVDLNCDGIRKTISTNFILQRKDLVSLDQTNDTSMKSLRNSVMNVPLHCVLPL